MKTDNIVNNNKNAKREDIKINIAVTSNSSGSFSTRAILAACMEKKISKK